MGRIRPRFSIRWLLALVAMAGVGIWLLVEVTVRGPERARRWEAARAHSSGRASLWYYLAGQYADGTAERRACQEMADWHLSRLRGLEAAGSSSVPSGGEAEQEARERALVHRLGLGDRLSPSFGLSEPGRPKPPDRG